MQEEKTKTIKKTTKKWHFPKLGKTVEANTLAEAQDKVSKKPKKTTKE